MFCQELTSAVAGHVHLLAHLVTGAEALDLVTVWLLDHHHHGLQCYNKSFVSSFSPGPLTLHCLNYTNMDHIDLPGIVQFQGIISYISRCK